MLAPDGMLRVGLAKAVLAPDRDALGGADHASALKSCRVTAAKAEAAVAVATAMVDDSVDPGRRLHCDHERPSGAEPGARHPAKPATSTREPSVNSSPALRLRRSLSKLNQSLRKTVVAWSRNKGEVAKQVG